MALELGHATLREIADELKERAWRICTRCKGYGWRPDYATCVNVGTGLCNLCGGTGREIWDQELDAIAYKLLRLVEKEDAVWAEIGLPRILPQHDENCESV